MTGMIADPKPTPIREYLDGVAEAEVGLDLDLADQLAETPEDRLVVARLRYDFVTANPHATSQELDDAALDLYAAEHDWEDWVNACYEASVDTQFTIQTFDGLNNPAAPAATEATTA